MILSVQTTYRGIERTERLDALVREEASILDRFFNGVVSCRTLIEQPHAHHRQGAPFHVRIEIGVPGKELVISHTPDLRDTLRGEEIGRTTKSSEIDAEHKDVELAIRDAFRKAGRQLQDYARRKTGDVKTHEAPLSGEVLKLGRDYGFLLSPDGVEVYFHRNSVLNGAFDRLHIGSTVRYAEEEGEKGPQASTVTV